MNAPRKNELTAVVNRNLFDVPPGDVVSDADTFRWVKFRQDYHAAQKLEKVAPFPLQIDFELNYLCNFGCRFCPHGNPESPQPAQSDKLTFADFCSIIDEGAKFGLCSIKLNYINEPLTVRDIGNYIAYAKSRGVLNVYFATNGTLLTENVSKMLIASHVSKIMVSLDAVTKETFKEMRNSDRFDEIVSNIHRLIRMRKEAGVSWPLVRVNFVNTPHNQHELNAFISAWKGVADMIGIEQQVGLPGMDNIDIITQKDYDDFRCSFPFKLVVVDSRGFILPCCTFSGREMPIGHIRTNTIQEAWLSDTMCELRNTHRNYRALSNDVCKHCLGL